MERLYQFASRHQFSAATASVGFVFTVLAFTSEWFGSHLQYAVLPGTVAFLLASGGEAGGPDIMVLVGAVLGTLVNTLLYALPGLLLDKFRFCKNKQ
jgi:LytS/YehU family sensor histidine kinase